MTERFRCIAMLSVLPFNDSRLMLTGTIRVAVKRGITGFPFCLPVSVPVLDETLQSDVQLLKLRQCLAIWKGPWATTTFLIITILYYISKARLIYKTTFLFPLMDWRDACSRKHCSYIMHKRINLYVLYINIHKLCIRVHMSSNWIREVKVHALSEHVHYIHH